jgi:trehalose synthase
MVAGEAGGIPLQMPGGAGGFLVGSVKECAEKLLRLLRNRNESEELALWGKEIVRERFLITRLIADELELYTSLLGYADGSVLGRTSQP